MYAEIIPRVLVNSELSSLFFLPISHSVKLCYIKNLLILNQPFSLLMITWHFFPFPFILEPSLFAFIIVTAIQMQLFSVS